MYTHCRLNGEFVCQLAKLHYESRYKPPRKAFDFYAAAALARFMMSRDLSGSIKRRLFYSGEYGLSLVSDSENWEATLNSYVSRIDTKITDEDNDFVNTKK